MTHVKRCETQRINVDFAGVFQFPKMLAILIAFSYDLVALRGDSFYRMCIFCMLSHSLFAQMLL